MINIKKTIFLFKKSYFTFIPIFTNLHHESENFIKYIDPHDKGEVLVRTCMFTKTQKLASFNIYIPILQKITKIDIGPKIYKYSIKLFKDDYCISLDGELNILIDRLYIQQYVDKIYSLSEFSNIDNIIKHYFLTLMDSLKLYIDKSSQDDSYINIFEKNYTYLSDFNIIVKYDNCVKKIYDKSTSNYKDSCENTIVLKSSKDGGHIFLGPFKMHVNVCETLLNTDPFYKEYK